MKLVVVSANGQAGIVARHEEAAEAQADADARAAVWAAAVTVAVVDEADLDAYVASVGG